MKPQARLTQSSSGTGTAVAEIAQALSNLGKALAAGIAVTALGVTLSSRAQVILEDPPNDQSGPPDIIVVVAGFARGNLHLTARFDFPNFNASFRGFNFWLDVDEDLGTGDPPPSSLAGRDLSISYSPLLDTNSPLSARVIEYPSRQTVGRVPFSFTGDSVSVIVPLGLLHSDDGVMNVGMNASFMGSRPPDRTSVMIQSDAVPIQGPTTALPELTITAAGSDLRVSWPASVTSYVLEVAPTFESPVQWQRATNAVVIVGTEAIVAPSSLAGINFYRLSLPLPAN